MKHPRPSRSQQLHHGVVIVDGISGSGKTLYTDIVPCLSGVPTPRFSYQLEFLCLLEGLGFIEDTPAIVMSRNLIDNLTYDSLISREVNFRPTDLTSVLKWPHGLSSISRLAAKDGSSVVDRAQQSRSGLSLVTHQLGTFTRILETALGENLTRLIALRHPWFLFQHWASYVEFHGSSPHDFTLMFLTGEEEGEVPWFTLSYANQWLKADKYDKAALALTSLTNIYLDMFEAASESTQTLFFPFERFVLDPTPYLEQLERMSRRRFSQRTLSIALKRQHVPRTHILDGPRRRIYKRYGQAGKMTRLSAYGNELRMEWSGIERCISSHDVLDRFHQVGERYIALVGEWT